MVSIQLPNNGEFVDAVIRSSSYTGSAFIYEIIFSWNSSDTSLKGTYYR